MEHNVIWKWKPYNITEDVIIDGRQDGASDSPVFDVISSDYY